MRPGSAILLSAALCALLSSCPRRDQSASGPAAPPERSGTAVIITGAAARIPQEAALLEELDARGLLKDLVFISGDSSGALNAVALNGVLTGRMTWDQYKSLLFGITNGDIFAQNAKRLPVDTSPARALYARVVEDRLGFRTIGELPYTTAISITRLKDLGLEKTAYRMCSRKINEESDPSLGLVDILMASSAFPVVFPPVRIRGVSTIPDIEYVDGGAGEDYIPYAALLEFEKHRGQGVDTVFIISRKNDGVPEISEELALLGLNDHKLLDDLGISFDAVANRRMLKSLESYRGKAPELAARTYVWKPEYDQNFLLFDFSRLKDQYDLTTRWAKNHDPVPLGEYLAGSANKR